MICAPKILLDNTLNNDRSKVRKIDIKYIILVTKINYSDPKALLRKQQLRMAMILFLSYLDSKMYC